jgi:hypothetical protein
LVPVAGLETAKPVSRAFACVCNRLQERMLRSQKQNAKNAPKRRETKGNEKVLSSIVIKILPCVILCSLSAFQSIRARSELIKKLSLPGEDDFSQAD